MEINEIIPPVDKGNITREIAFNASTAQLKKWFSDYLAVTAENLMNLAIIWRELESRGEDLSQLRTGLTAYLGLIASNKLSPNVVVRCAGKTTLLGKMLLLPLSKQEEISQKGIPYIEKDEDGNYKQKYAPLELATRQIIAKAFDNNGLKPPEKQIDEENPKRFRSPNGVRKPTTISISVQHEEYTNIQRHAKELGLQIPKYIKQLVLNDCQPQEENPSS